MKKLTQIAVATLLTSSAYAETLTFHGKEQALANFLSQPTPGQNNENVLRKKIRIFLHNPNSFNVNVRISTQKRTSGANSANAILDTPTAENVTINANSGYIYEPDPSGNTAVFPSILSSYENGQRMCDLDMYTVITSTIDTSNSHLNCEITDAVTKISWQSTTLRNSNSTIKSVSSITGTLGYYHQFDKSFDEGAF